MSEAVGLSARAGAFRLHDVTFTVPAGGWGVVIGPAGAGKTTLLETMAGIVPRTGGTLRLAGRDGVPRDVSALPPEARDVGIVYQHAYLFPHLSARENVAYGTASLDVAREAAERVGAGPLLDRDVRSLSGGERQLVALARALARRPAALLLDEPFSALDPRRRDVVRRAVREAHRELGLTVLQVTHDFAEAGLLGDVAILLDRGRVLQHGAPEEIFRRPASPWVAEFLGAENVWAGTARRTADGELEFRSAGGALVLHAVGDAPEGSCHAVLRGEEVVLAPTPHPSSARNQFRGRVVEVAPSGPLARVTLDVAGTPLVAVLTSRSAREMELRAGEEVWATFKAMAVHLC